MANVTWYRSDDVGAPTLDSSQGSLLTVLRACLVDGYGSKAAAGWTLELNDIATNGTMLLKNNSTQLAKYYRFQDNGHQDDAPGIAGTDPDVAVMYGCESYVNINDTSGNFPNLDIQGDANPDTTNNGITVLKSTSVDSQPKPWMIIADDKTVNFIANIGGYSNLWSTTNYNSVNNMISFGDLGKLGDSATNVNLGHVAGNGFTGAYSSTNLKYPACSIDDGRRYLNRSYTATGVGAIEYGLNHIHDYLFGSTFIGEYSNAAGYYPERNYPSDAFNGIVFSDLIVFEDTYAPEHVNSFSQYSINKRFPQASALGVRSTVHMVGGTGNATFDFLDSVIIHDRTHIAITLRYNTSYYACFIQVDGEFI